MTGLRLMNEIMDPALREEVLSQHIFHDAPADVVILEQPPIPSGELRSPKVRSDIAIPPRLIWTAAFATSRTWPKSGATSIRSCSMAGISASKDAFRKVLSRTRSEGAGAVSRRRGCKAESRELS